MQGLDEQREPGDLEVIEVRAAPFRGAAGAADDAPPALTEGFVHDVLAAVVAMALRSKRRQADLDAALWSAGVAAERAQRLAALERLRSRGCVDKVVMLSDGGVLLSVTGHGLDQLNGARPR